MNITVVEGIELARLVQALNDYSLAGDLRALRISQQGDQVKFKINGGMWTYPVGRDGRS